MPELNSLFLKSDPKLVHYWRYEGNANDSVGTANGTVNGTVSNVAAKFGNGYSHPGTTGNYIDYGDVNIATQGSLSFWINFTDFTTGANGGNVYPITRRDASTANGTWQVLLNNSTFAWTLSCYDGTSFFSKVSNNAPIVTNQWYFLTFVWDIANAGGSAIYLNAQSLGTPTDQTSAAFSTTATGISMRTGYSANATAGANMVLDDVAIWSRKLTANEVSILYSGIPPAQLFSVPSYQFSFKDSVIGY